MDSIFLDITVIIAVAAGLSLLFRLFNQPAILAYILTGILLGPLGLFHVQNSAALQTLGDLGITLLLFMLGLELKLNELRSIGKTAVVIGMLQIWFTFVLGFFLSLFLRFPQVESLFIGIATAFSSTVVVVKVFSDKKDLNSLHGKITVGVLLVQDFAAILLLILFSGTHLASDFSILIAQVLLLGLKVVITFTTIIMLSKYIFPTLTRMIAKSPESLFLFSLAWVFVLTAFVSSKFVGFSPEIGGFLAGLALANTNENFQIIGRMKALRDFFITIFFVMLGLQMSFANAFGLVFPALILSGFILCVKPILVFFLCNVLGFRSRTSFLVSLSLGQMSEFSLLLIFLGQKLGYLSSDTVTLLVLVALISFAISTYAMQNSSLFYRYLHTWLEKFEMKQSHALHNGNPDHEELENLKNHLVIIGGHQMGMSVLHALEKDEQVLLIDFDPDVVKRLRDKRVLSFFGDISDPDIQERAKLNKAKLVISTVPDIEDNLLLIQRMNKENRRAKIIVMAYEIDDAKRLYKAGADYVVLPHLAGGRHLAKILEDDDLSQIDKYKKKDLDALK